MSVDSGYSTTLSATTDYTLEVAFSQLIPIGSQLTFRSDFNGYCPPETPCGHNFENATINLAGDIWPWNDSFTVQLSSSISAGISTIVLSDVLNPANSGMYSMRIEVRLPGSEGPGENTFADNPIFLGNIAVKGQVKMPDGNPASSEHGVGVNVRTQDFNFNYGTGVDQNGWYVIPKVTQNGTLVSGTTYMIDAWPGSTPGVISPDTVSFVYNGSTITKNITLITASKTINATVVYENGDPVTTANVWANKRDGGSHVGTDTDSNGEALLSMSGGSWDVGVNCGWDQELQQQKDCDWSYNSQATMVDFANNSTIESEDITFTVQQTNARIRGTVYFPDGVTPFTGGYVDIKSGNQGGNGSGINQGSFSANVKAGDYKVTVYPDNMNPDLAKYYSDEISVRVGEDQTKTLTVVMKEKTSAIKGKVMDTDGNGVPSVWLNGWVRNGQGWGNVQTEADGTFTMYVQAGDWQLQLDQGRNEGGNYISANQKSDSILVTEGQTVTGIVINVQLADARVNVKIVDNNGNAVTDTYGWAYCRKSGGGFGPGSEFGAGVDRGSASIPLLGGYDFVCGMNMPPEGNRSLLDEVELTVGKGETKDIKLTLVDNDSAIIGWVKDQNGNIVTGLAGQAEAAAVGMGGNMQYHPGIINDDGSYRISLLGGTNDAFVVQINIFGAQEGNSQFVATQPEPSEAVTVPASTEVVKIVTIYRADTYVEGVVQDPSGNPMPHVWINADNYKQMEGKMKGDFAGGKVLRSGTESRGDGTFRLNLVSGTYMLNSGLPPEFESDYMSPEGVEITVTSGTPATGIVMKYRNADAYVTASGTLEDGTVPNMGFCHAWNPEGGNSGREMMGGNARIPLTTGSWWIGCDTYNPDTNKFYRSEEQQISVVTGDDKSKSFVMKQALFNIPESFSQTFTATQQNNFTLPDGTTIMMPANAAGSDDSTYTFRATPATDLMFTDSDKPLTFAWDLEVTKQSDSNTELVEQFDSSVQICMPLPEEYLGVVGLTAEDVFPKYWNSTAGAWQVPDTAVVTDSQACLQVDHFTQFALTTGATFGASASAGGPADVIATPVSGGGPQVTVWDGDGNMLVNFFAYSSSLRMGIQAVVGDVNGDGENEIVVAPGAGAGPQIRIFNMHGQVIGQFFAFPTNIRAGLNLAVSDVDGDGTDEIIVTTMPGVGPQIRIFNGQGEVESQFFAFPTTFRGGVNLTTGDVDGDGVNEIIVVPASAGGPQVRVFDHDGTVVSQFMAYASSIRGGYHVTTGDIDADGTADVIVTPGPGLGPQVAMFNGNGTLVGRFFAYATTFRGGLNVSVGDVSGDGENEIVASPESGAGPHIRVFNTQGEVVSQFFAYSKSLRGNFTSLLADLNQDGTSDIITAPGKGMGPHVRAFNYAGEVIAQFFTHHTGFRGGINIGSMPAL
ncbi:MAG: VCBS repeat-containing protein [Patescibacteria group bacterium]|jgi:hypothetical protein